MQREGVEFHRQVAAADKEHVPIQRPASPNPDFPRFQRPQFAFDGLLKSCPQVIGYIPEAYFGGRNASLPALGPLSI